MEAIAARANLLTTIRSFLWDRNIIEVQTPLLGEATVTDADVESIAVPGYGFLQTSPEYFMKRLLAAGVPDCYQLGPVFRHDEVGRWHNPEFTLLEWYRLHFDHQQLMQELAALMDVVLGPKPVKIVDYADLVDDIKAPRDELDLQFASACAELKPGRFFVVNYPPDQAALARLTETGAARFEMVIDGVEIANGYWELLDPQEHRQRFAQDVERRVQRGLPTRHVDSKFLHALDHGLPSCAGVALGVDRLLMLAMGKRHLDEVLAFRS